MLRKKSGFSLVELLVVIAIITILLSLVAASIHKIRITVLRADVKATITNLESALKMYQSDFGVFPPSDSSQGNEFGELSDNQGGKYVDGALVRHLDGDISNDDNPGGRVIQYFEFQDGEIVENGNTPIFMSVFSQPFLYNELQSDGLSRRVVDSVDPDDPFKNVVTFATLQIVNQADALDEERDRFITNYRKP